MLRLYAVRAIKDLLTVSCKSHIPIFAGVDLGLPKRTTTGIAILCTHCKTVWVTQATPTEALAACLWLKPAVIAIDAPLSLPVGEIERPLEKLCRALGYKLIPPLLGPMRRLTKTGIAISETLGTARIKVIETHPKSALLAAGMKGLKNVLYTNNEARLTRHMIDAAISSLVAASYYYNLHTYLQDKYGNSLVLLSADFMRAWLRNDT